MEFLNFNSVELLPNAKASAAFMVDSGKVFREDICTLYSVICWLRPSCYRSLCNYKYVCITLTYSQLSLYSILRFVIIFPHNVIIC